MGIGKKGKKIVFKFAWRAKNERLPWPTPKTKRLPWPAPGGLSGPVKLEQRSLGQTDLRQIRVHLASLCERT